MSPDKDPLSHLYGANTVTRAPEKNWPTDKDSSRSRWKNVERRARSFHYSLTNKDPRDIFHRSMWKRAPAILGVQYRSLGINKPRIETVACTKADPRHRPSQNVAHRKKNRVKHLSN